jgi:CheY-like chemotaxis protein
MAPQVERRRHARVDVEATAIVCRGDVFVGNYLVTQMSAGGAVLAGEPQLGIGERLRVLLRWPSRMFLALDADVVRHPGSRGEEAAVAVAFRNVPAALEDRIQSGLLSRLDASDPSRRRAVLIVDDCPAVLRALDRELRTLGHRTVCAETPREARKRLRALGDSIDVALVDLFLGEGDGLDLLSYVGAHHPEVRRVLMSGQASPAQLTLATAWQKADAVLCKPWSREKLAGVLAL